jgi:hypothetical protein
MIRKFLTLLALACLLAAPTVASAEPSAKALALTRRMVVAMHVEETMTPMMRTLMRQQVEMIAAQQKGLTSQQRTMLSGAVGEALDEVLNDGFMSDIMERLIPAYAEVYSEDELEALVQFYESPMGQRVLHKMPLLGPAATKVMIDITPKMEAQVVEKLTKKLEGFQALGK